MPSRVIQAMGQPVGRPTGGLVPPAGSAADQQRNATFVAFLGAQDEDESMKKKLRNKLKNDFSLSIRDGGIRIPGEVLR